MLRGSSVQAYLVELLLESLRITVEHKYTSHTLASQILTNHCILESQQPRSILESLYFSECIYISPHIYSILVHLAAAPVPVTLISQLWGFLVRGVLGSEQWTQGSWGSGSEARLPWPRCRSLDQELSLLELQKKQQETKQAQHTRRKKAATSLQGLHANQVEKNNC